MSAYITVEGEKCLVTESGFQSGYKVKYAMHNGVERVAVFRNGRWEWWTAQDRLTPAFVESVKRALEVKP